MLEKSRRNELFNALGLPPAGQRLVMDAARHAPVRRVSSKGGGNVISFLQSRKMGCAIVTESRHLEFPAAVALEHNPDVLEYFAQPVRLQFDVMDGAGQSHHIDHIPDFLVVTEQRIWLRECKPQARLARLAQRYPWRYRFHPDHGWHAPLIEAWLAERGLGYEIFTEEQLSQRWVENTLLLEDYLALDCPPCPVDVTLRVHQLLAAHPYLYLAELYEQAHCKADDVFKLIADGQLITDMEEASLTEPTRCRVYRDRAVRQFESCRHAPVPLVLPGSIDLVVGTRLTYDGQPFTLAMIGTSKAVLTDAQGRSVEVSREVLEQLVAQQNVLAVDESVVQRDRAQLAHVSADKLKQALQRQQDLAQAGNELTRNQRRYKKAIQVARLAGADELIALIPRTSERGNRLSRLSLAQESAINQVIQLHYLQHPAPNAQYCHQQLRHLCHDQGITPPSYPTLIKRIKLLSQQQADRARHGNRVAYQNADFVNVLYVDTPVHGSRIFQYVHLDHTELDIELVSGKNGRHLGRPWLSLAIDAFSRRILALYLSYDPPSYRSNMMLLRDMVRRYHRLPQFMVVDNGADFRCDDFRLFCELMGIHLRYRPAGQPRSGSVMERIFGRVHSAYIHNLAGNTKAMRNVRSTTGKFLPSRLAQWDLQALYYGLDYWAFTFYDQEVHGTLGMSPKEAFDQSEAVSGVRENRLVTLTPDFLILTCPMVDRTGQRTIDRQRGIKVHNHFYYWTPEFSRPSLHGKKVPVRYDPWDSSTVYVQIDQRWHPARCKSLAALGRCTEKERQLLSQELLQHYRSSQLRAHDDLSVQRLQEFMRIFTPSGSVALALERQGENRSLYQDLHMAAVPHPRLISGPIEEFQLKGEVSPPAAAAEQISMNATVAPAPAALPAPGQPDDDIPDFDTF